jgi:hypothetical protein
MIRLLHSPTLEGQPSCVRRSDHQVEGTAPPIPIKLCYKRDQSSFYDWIRFARQRDATQVATINFFIVNHLKYKEDFTISLLWRNEFPVFYLADLRAQGTGTAVAERQQTQFCHPECDIP